MSDCRIVVVSCQERKAVQEMWWTCQKRNWPDCPFPIDILTQDDGLGWNGSLIGYLRKAAPFILLMLDDHFIDASIHPTELTMNIERVLELMRARSDIGMIKVQAGNAASPELPFDSWNRLAAYDREPHPFKRTNLVPTMFRRDWLKRLSETVRWRISLLNSDFWSDTGRRGALAFERLGTLVTIGPEWPELILGINRGSDDANCSKSLLNSFGNDAIREGRLQPHVITAMTEAGISLEPLAAYV